MAPRQIDVSAVDVHQFSARKHTGARDIDQGAADLRRGAPQRRHLIDLVSPGRAGIDQAGDAVLQAHRRPFLGSQRVGVQVDQARRDDLAAGINGVAGIARKIGSDRHDPAARNRDIAHRVEPDRRIDDPPALDDEIVAGRERAASAGEQRGGSSRRADELAPVQHGFLPGSVIIRAGVYQPACLCAPLLSRRGLRIRPRVYPADTRAVSRSTSASRNALANRVALSAAHTSPPQSATAS
jgi:hypothetical protein